MKDKGIVRNALKIEASINNAQRFIEIREEFGTYDKYIWSFTNGKAIQNKWKDPKQIPTKTDLSDKISADLKKRGFKFVGSTSIYAMLQGIGVVNDHTVECFRYRELKS